MPKCYRIIATYEDGSTENFGSFNTREGAENRLLSLEQELRDVQRSTNNFYTMPEEFEIKEVFVFKV